MESGHLLTVGSHRTVVTIDTDCGFYHSQEGRYMTEDNFQKTADKVTTITIIGNIV